MVQADQKKMAPPGIAIWVPVTLLWGTVFYWTSIVMLQLASVRLGQGDVHLSASELLQVYGVQVIVLVIVAVVAMGVKGMVDPGGKKQIQRWQNISEGKGEKIFVSFAGSLATSFFFTVLTALTVFVCSGVFGFNVVFTLPVVLLAALFNVGAGITASLVVGLIFLITKAGLKR